MYSHKYYDFRITQQYYSLNNRQLSWTRKYNNNHFIIASRAYFQQEVSRPLGVYYHQVSVNMKLTCIYWFTGLDILACDKLNPDVLLPYISPCCFERGVEWILLVPPLFQAYICRIVGLCDTFIFSKWIWQVIYNVLQIFWTHGSDLWVRGFEA